MDRTILTPEQTPPDIEERRQKVLASSAGFLTYLRVNQLPKVLKGQASRERKYILIQKLADKAFDKIKSATPCGQGCSFCCSMAVPISDTEVKIIEDFTGQKAASIYYPPPSTAAAATIDRLNNNAVKYRNVPCSFLKDGKCSIYEVRPVVCRTHNVVEATNEKCDLSGPLQGAHIFDLAWADYAIADLCLNETWADIREFFPHDSLHTEQVQEEKENVSKKERINQNVAGS